METPSEFRKVDANWPYPESYTLSDRLEYLQAVSRSYYDCLVQKNPSGVERRQYLDEMALTVNRLGQTIMDLSETSWLSVNIPTRDQTEEANKWRKYPFAYIPRKAIEGEVTTFLIPMSDIERAKHFPKGLPQIMIYLDAYERTLGRKVCTGFKLNLSNCSLNSMSSSEVGDILAYSWQE